MKKLLLMVLSVGFFGGVQMANAQTIDIINYSGSRTSIYACEPETIDTTSKLDQGQRRDFLALSLGKFLGYTPSQSSPIASESSTPVKCIYPTNVYNSVSMQKDNFSKQTFTASSARTNGYKGSETSNIWYPLKKYGEFTTNGIMTSYIDVNQAPKFTSSMVKGALKLYAGTASHSLNYSSSIRFSFKIPPLNEFDTRSVKTRHYYLTLYAAAETMAQCNSSTTELCGTPFSCDSYRIVGNNRDWGSEYCRWTIWFGGPPGSIQSFDVTPAFQSGTLIRYNVGVSSIKHDKDII